MRLLQRRVRAQRHGHRHARGTRWTDRGAAAVETALCLCFIAIPLIFGIIEFGAMLTFRQALSQAASEGARATVGAPSGDYQAVADAAIKNVMDNQTYLPTNCGSGGGLACTVATQSCGTHTCVKVTVSTHYKDLDGAISFPGLDFALPNTLTFTSTVQVS